MKSAIITNGYNHVLFTCLIILLCALVSLSYREDGLQYMLLLGMVMLQ